MAAKVGIHGKRLVDAVRSSNIMEDYASSFNFPSHSPFLSYALTSVHAGLLGLGGRGHAVDAQSDQNNKELNPKQHKLYATLTSDYFDELDTVAKDKEHGIESALFNHIDAALRDYQVQIDSVKDASYKSIYTDPIVGEAALAEMKPIWVDYLTRKCAVVAAPKDWNWWISRHRAWRTKLDSKGRAKGDPPGKTWDYTRRTGSAPIIPFSHIPLRSGDIRFYRDLETCRVSTAVFKPVSPDVLFMSAKWRFFVLFDPNQLPLPIDCPESGKVVTDLEGIRDLYKQVLLKEALIDRADMSNSSSATICSFDLPKTTPQNLPDAARQRQLELGDIGNISDPMVIWLMLTYGHIEGVAEALLQRTSLGNNETPPPGILDTTTLARRNDLARNRVRFTPGSGDVSLSGVPLANVKALRFHAYNRPTERKFDLKESEYITMPGTKLTQYVAPVAPMESAAILRQRLNDMISRSFNGLVVAPEMNPDSSGIEVSGASDNTTGSNISTSKVVNSATVINQEAMATKHADTTISTLGYLFKQVYKEVCSVHDTDMILEFRAEVIALLKKFDVARFVGRFLSTYNKDSAGTIDMGIETEEFLETLPGIQEEAPKEEKDDEEKKKKNEGSGKNKEKAIVDEVEDIAKKTIESLTDMQEQIEYDTCYDGLMRLFMATELILTVPGAISVQLVHKPPRRPYAEAASKISGGDDRNPFSALADQGVTALPSVPKTSTNNNSDTNKKGK